MTDVEMSKPGIVLIGGYGRSGSTILDVLLSREIGGVSLGELRYLKRHIDRGLRKCACGEFASDCKYWSLLLKKIKVTSRSVLESDNILGYLFGSSSKVSKTYEVLLEAAEEIGGLPIVVDSSKTASGAWFRPLSVFSACGSSCDIIYIFVFRSPSGVLRSVMGGSNEKLAAGQDDNSSKIFRYLKCLYGWNTANLAGLANYYYLRNKGKEVHWIDLSSEQSFHVVREALSIYRTRKGFVGQSGSLLHTFGGNRLSAELESNVCFRKEQMAEHLLWYEKLFHIISLPVYSLIRYLFRIR